MHLPTFTWPHLLPKVLATFSIEIFGYVTEESLHPKYHLLSQVTLARSQDSFVAPEEVGPAAASKLGSAYLNTWQFCLSPLVLHSPGALSIGHDIWLFKGGDQYKPETQGLVRKSWPMKNRRCEGWFSSPLPIQLPTVPKWRCSIWPAMLPVRLCQLHTDPPCFCFSGFPASVSYFSHSCCPGIAYPPPSLPILPNKAVRAKFYLFCCYK